MNLEAYRQRLLEKETEIVARMKEAGRNARELVGDPDRDIADDSIRQELKEEQFMEADTDWAILQQVRQALVRIEEGTFGRCLADGKPIDEKRLAAIPWTPYCQTHQQEIERSRLTRTPTL